jgi:hypothetical protein
MLSFISRFGSSKGMVKVPKLDGKSNATALAEILAIGLKIDPLSRVIPTNVLLQNDIVLTQFPAADTLVDYETPIIVNYGAYVADTITIGNCEKYGTTTNDADYCNGTQTIYGSARTKRRKEIKTKNNITGETVITYDYNCTDDVVSRGSAYVNGQCGYVTPPTTCTYSISYGAYGACNAPAVMYSEGTKTRTVSGTNTNCQPFSYPESATCCQEVCNSWSAWDTLPSDPTGAQERRGRLCQYTDCSRKVEEQRRCKTTTTITYGGCGSNKKRIQTTKVKNLCTGAVTTTTASVPCNAI